MSPRYFLYLRKSCESEERQALSIESQLTELKQYAGQSKLQIHDCLIESQSAKIPGRPIFDAMIARMERGEASGIIAWHPDRLARNTVDGGRIIYMLDTGHIQSIKFPTFWFENTSQGKFMLGMAFSQSKYYVDNLSENIRRGLRQKIRRGEWPGIAPLGYLIDRNLRRIVPDPAKAKLVRRLFTEYATGRYSLASLRRTAFNWGLMSRYGTPLSHSEVQRTLKRPFYYGAMAYNNVLHDGIHEPLINKKLFDAVQEIMYRRRKLKFWKVRLMSKGLH